MKKDVITVYAMEVQDRKPCKGRLRKMQNTLKGFQEYVGGNIEVYPLTEEIEIILNEEGKLIDLPPNRYLSIFGMVIENMVGNICCCRYDEEGNFMSILESDIWLIQEYLLPHSLQEEEELPEYQEGGIQ